MCCSHLCFCMGCNSKNLGLLNVEHVSVYSSLSGFLIQDSVQHRQLLLRSKVSL